MVTIAKTGNVFLDPCVQLYLEGSPEDSDCDANNAMIETTLTQNGEYTVVVTELNNDATGEYNATLQCIGSCQDVVLFCPEASLIFSDGFEP